MVSRPLEPEADHSAGGKLSVYGGIQACLVAGFFSAVGLEERMTIRVNGLTEECTQGVTLLEFLEGRGLNVHSVVVEHNRTIVVADDFGSIRLSAGDELEILHFVGGG